MNSQLPSYSDRLEALHRAFQSELTAIVDSIPLRTSDRVLDAGCGDGFFTQLLYRRMNNGGQLIAFDRSAEYLHLAQQQVQPDERDPAVQFQLGDVQQLPFPAASFDLIWCAHSMQSFHDPKEALREFRRVLRPGGTIAILETDNIHGMILPWPEGLELAVLTAEEKALQELTSRDGLYFLRFAERYLSESGFTKFRRITHAIDRQTPFEDAFREYITIYLADLYHRVEPYLADDQRTAAAHLLLPSSPQFIPILEATCVTIIHGLVLAQ